MSEKLPGYGELLKDLKARIASARVKAVLAVNEEMIRLYWDIGRMIVERQQIEKWGKSVVGQISRDLKAEFPGQKGFSTSNLWFMRQFYLEWRNHSKLPAPGENVILLQPVRELVSGSKSETRTEQERGMADGEEIPLRILGKVPWGHNIDLLTKLRDPAERLWYARKVVENGWNRNVLTIHIERNLFGSQGAALTNFSRTLPATDSDLAREVFKDNYIFDFVAGAESMRERELSKALVNQITRFLT